MIRRVDSFRIRDDITGDETLRKFKRSKDIVQTEPGRLRQPKGVSWLVRVQYTIAVNIGGLQEKRYHLARGKRTAGNKAFRRRWSAWGIRRMNGIEIANKEVRLTSLLTQDTQNGLHLLGPVLLILALTPSMQVRSEETERQVVPAEFDLQECLIEYRKAMILMSHRGQTAHPGYMIGAIGFSKDQVHAEVVGQLLHMRSAIGLQNGNNVGLLLLDDSSNEWKAILPTLPDIVTKHAQRHGCATFPYLSVRQHESVFIRGRFGDTAKHIEAVVRNERPPTSLISWYVTVHYIYDMHLRDRVSYMVGCYNCGSKFVHYGPAVQSGVIAINPKPTSVQLQTTGTVCMLQGGIF